MPTALILGVASQDGSYLAELLLQKKYQVIGTVRDSPEDNLENISQVKDRIVLAKADLLSYDSIASLVKKYTPDEFYNLAALTVPTASWSRAYLVGQVTGLGPLQGLEAIRRLSPRTRFFQATSSGIFGTPGSGVADENSPVSPQNPYAAAKTYAHFMTRVYREHNGLFACSGILFNHESPRRPLEFVTRKITTAVACIKNKISSPVLNSDGRLVLWDLESPRDRGFAGDFVKGIWLILQAGEPKDYVVATNSLHTVREICEIAFACAGLNWKEHVLVKPPENYRPETTGIKGDYSKIDHDLGWSPQTGFRDLIEMMVKSDLSRLN
jgi:GDPmannose 4,6-dehydratase